MVGTAKGKPRRTELKNGLTKFDKNGRIRGVTAGKTVRPSNKSYYFFHTLNPRLQLIPPGGWPHYDLAVPHTFFILKSTPYPLLPAGE
jgi:hypothetical protein